MRPCRKSTALMLVLLLWFWCGFVFAEKTPLLKGSVLVLPLQAGKGLSDEQIALGFAVQNVIENMLTLHSGLEEVWFNWHVNKLLPKEQDLKSWLRGKNKPPPTVAGLGMRYLLAGQIIRQGSELRTTLELSDRAKGGKLTRELLVDLPGLERFRREFISLLAQAGIPVPEAQKTKMLWHEELSPQAFALLGRGLLAYSSTSAFEKNNPVYDPKPFEEALKLSPRSYLLLNGLGWVAYANKKYPDAISFFERALTLNPTGVDAADGMLNCRLETGDDALAEAWEEKKAESKGIASRRVVGLILESLSSHGQGEKTYEKTDYQLALDIETYENQLYWWRGDPVYESLTLKKLADAYTGLKQYDKSIFYLEQMLLIHLGNVDREGTILNNLGTAYVSLSQYDKAINYYTLALAHSRKIKDHAGEGTTLNNLGNVHESLSQYDKAIDYYHQALGIRREIKDHAGEGSSLYGLGHAYRSLSQYGKAIEYFTQAFAIQHKIKGRPGEGTTLSNLGAAYTSLGQYGKGIDYYTQALAIQQEFKGGAVESRPLSNLGDYYASLGQYDKAINYYQQSLAIQREIKDRAGEGTTLSNLGAAYVSLSQYNKAINYYTQSLAIQREAKDRVGEGMILNNLGAAYVSLSQYDKAINYYTQSLAIQREAKDRVGEGTALNNLGDAFASLRQYHKALDYYSQALAIQREIKDRAGVYSSATVYNGVNLAIQRIKDRAGEGATLSKLGAAYRSLNQYGKAIDYYTQALAIQREVKDDAVEGRILNNLGEAYASLSQYGKAIEYITQALAIQRENKDRAGEGTTLSNLGEAYRLLNQYGKAIEYYTQSLSIQREIKDRTGEGRTLSNLGATYASLSQYDKAIDYYTQSLAIQREVKDRAGEGTTLNYLGAAYASLSQYNKALDYYQQALTIVREVKKRAAEADFLYKLMFAWKAKHKPRLAIFYGKQAVNAYQEVRGHIQKLEKESQQSFLKSKESAYRQLAELLIGEGRLPEAQQVLGMLKEEEYFDFVRRDAQDADSLQTRSEFNPAEAEADRRYREIADRLTALGAEYSGLAAKVVRSPAEEQRLAQLEADLGIAGQAFEKFLDELETEFDSATAATNLVQNIRDAEALMEVLRELEPGTLAIYTLVSEDKYHAIVITPDVQLAHEYAIPGAELNRKVLAFREALQNPDSDPRPLAQELYRILVAPIENDLSGAKAKTLLWSLDGILRYLPIAALHDGQSYLAEGYRNVVFTPASLVNLKDRPNKTWKALGLGVSKAHEGFKALPSVVNELGGIIHVDGPGGTAGVLPGIVKLDQAFTQAAMLAALGMRNHPVVHIASHFRFRPGDYTASFLLLGDGSHLPLSQFKTLKNVFGGVDLLTLSACNTATGDAGANGKEVEGFGVLAQRKGAKAVVATLWEVADASTKELMQAFYRIRETGATKAEALRQAQLTLLHGEPQVTAPGGAGHDEPEAVAGGEAPKNSAKAPYAHPYFWSPFILIGNSR